MLTKKKFRFSLFDFFLYIFMIIVVLLILLPMIHMLAVSFSSDVYVMQGNVGLWPKGFTAKTYGYVFEDDRIFRSYGNTILYTVLGTTISLSITAMGAYALSAKRMIGHKFFSMMIVFTMFFQGGMIPTYLAGITSSSEISLATADLLTKVDCLTNLTDNTVVSSLPAILDKANEKGITVLGSEIEQVKIGCLAAEGIDYISLGKDTGKMAAKILKGEAKAEDMEYQLLTESNLYVNEKVAENLGITVPDSMNDRAVETFSEISPLPAPAHPGAPFRRPD